MVEIMTAIRWGDGRRADSDFAREQILDAACSCYAANTIYKTSMDNIAREAKISRTTIYRYFENRDEVLTGVLVRAVAEINARIRERVEPSETFAEYLVESQALLVEMVPQVPLFVLFLREQSAVMSRICIGSAEVAALMIDFYQDRFIAAQATGEVRTDVDIGQMIDWITHISSSYLLSPTSLRSGGYDWREMLQQFLLPAILNERVSR
ncbi:MAG: TetR/AcrR family transcriptional regulator [Verrucomicrobiaceae bacterium]|nr:TetR/AcrR family transcriptional regulator [Verrucomicrobiaceae bacterium]